jgi:hypothetical protein
MPMLELEVASMLVPALVLTRRGVVERWGLMSSLQAVDPRNFGTLVAAMPTWTWRGARTTALSRRRSRGCEVHAARCRPGYDPVIPHVQVGLLGVVKVPRVAQNCVEAVRVVLDDGVELDTAELSQAGAAHRRPKLKVAQLLEALPRRLALVLHEGEVPCLGRPTQVVGCQPRVIRRRGLLTAEELLAMVEPVQWIVEAVLCRELHLVEAWNSLTGILRPQRRFGGC